VLLNLLSNAVKFSNPGGQVAVGLTREGADYVFSVQDHGVGIAEEHQKVIFESFRQLEGGSTRRFGGTGLGLSIARELVMKHGGTLWVHSVLGQGSTFFFKVPLKGPPVTAAGLPVAIARPNENRTILIVEDDATTLETIKLALRPLGFVLVGTTDPRGAMGLLRDLKPDLLVLDVMMPHLSGLDLLRQLRESPDIRDTPVLVTSAYPANQMPSTQLGARWVPKPWQPRQLAQVAVELLDATAIAPAA
jgi:two-component system sensor histidine kinase VicK